MDVPEVQSDAEADEHGDVQYGDDGEAVMRLRFERINEWDRPNATYRLYCPACNLAVNVATPIDMVRRYTNCGSEADAPHDPDALAIWSIADLMSGDREKRAENRKVDMHEERLRERALYELAQGCPHAKTLTGLQARP